MSVYLRQGPTVPLNSIGQFAHTPRYQPPKYVCFLFHYDPCIIPWDGGENVKKHLISQSSFVQIHAKMYWMAHVPSYHHIRSIE